MLCPNFPATHAHSLPHSHTNALKPDSILHNDSITYYAKSNEGHLGVSLRISIMVVPVVIIIIVGKQRL